MEPTPLPACGPPLEAPAPPPCPSPETCHSTQLGALAQPLLLRIVDSFDRLTFALERLLERLPSGRFRIGPHVQELVSLAPRDMAPEDVAHPYLQDLADITGQPVQLVVLDGGESVTVDRADGQLPSRAPTRAPAHASCGGLVLLAYASAGLVDTVLETINCCRLSAGSPTISGSGTVSTRCKTARQKHGAALPRDPERRRR